MAVDIPLPPARFDHPYTGSAIVRQVSLADLEQICHRQWGIITNNIAYGCSWFDTDSAMPLCIIYIPRLDRDVDFATQQRVLRHETGHCNGWPKDHPR